MKPHKHAELIKAWADGAEIECLVQPSNKWELREQPIWSVDATYRIKPQPIVVEWLVAPKEVTYFDHAVKCAKKNIRLTFDAETHELKSAEVI